MKNITQENLHEFRPSYKEYSERLENFVADIGVESPKEVKDYEQALRKWNDKSAIGFSQEDIQILALIYKCDEQNARFDNDTFVHTSKGGNTAEHPMFMGLAFDSFKNAAGFTPESFDEHSPETLELAKLSQRVHAMIAVHDVGEVVDVSFAEQIKTGASKKEPQEEELVAPFKFKLASYAISSGQPELYEETIRDLKESALEAKRELYQDAMDGKITGDEFVDGFGKVIGTKIAEAEAHINSDDVRPELAESAANLSHIFEDGEAYKGMAGSMLAIIDKFEGGAHYAFFAGKQAHDIGAESQETDPEKRMFSRLFGNGESASYAMSNSQTMLSQMKYSQKMLVPTFDAADAEPEATREISQRLAGAAGAGIMRAVIDLLQKGPAFVDFDSTKDSEPSVDVSDDPEKQAKSFTQQLESQRSLRDKALPAMRERKGNITHTESVMDTKAVIAIFNKAADLMESGKWRPEKLESGMIFTPGEELPKELQVSKEELVASSKKYPLNVARDFRDDRFGGEAVCL